MLRKPKLDSPDHFNTVFIRFAHPTNVNNKTNSPKPGMLNLKCKKCRWHQPASTNTTDPIQWGDITKETGTIWFAIYLLDSPTTFTPKNYFDVQTIILAGSFAYRSPIHCSTFPSAAQDFPRVCEWLWVACVQHKTGANKKTQNWKFMFLPINRSKLRRSRRFVLAWLLAWELVSKQKEWEQRNLMPLLSLIDMQRACLSIPHPKSLVLSILSFSHFLSFSRGCVSSNSPWGRRRH